MSALGPTLQAFFTERLLRERNASPLTVGAYRDTWRLLLGFASQRNGKLPSALDFNDIDVVLVGAFLEHLERHRGNTIRTRNARLAAVHSLFRYAALRHPEHAAGIARVLAIGPKRFERALVSFLTEPEVEALLSAPDRTTWTGRRDRALLLVAVQTGLRISELIGLCGNDVHLGTGAHVVCRGKGRKERITPLTATVCPTLAKKNVTAHTLRHTAAMRLLEAGVDTTVIALWLGHEHVDTTAIYLQAHLAIKERALAKVRAPKTQLGRYRPNDGLLKFLEAL